MKLLLHVCCAPCATFPVDIIKNNGIEFQGFFYNPNIHPLEEFIKRKENVVNYFNKIENKIILFDDFMQDKWESYQGGNSERCNFCYSIRLQKCAIYAKENGYDAFSTTLLVSPYQNHDLIKVLAERYSIEHKIDFYYNDFRPGFRIGQQMAKEIGLYRQKYCGCIKSIR